MSETSKKRIKRAFRLLGLLLLFIVLFLFIFIKSATVQTYLAQKTGRILSKKTDANITIESVNFEWYKVLVLNNFLVLDHHSDTLLYAKKLDLRIEDVDFNNNDFSIEKLVLYSANIELIQYKGEDEYNFEKFIRKLELSQRDPSKKKVVSVQLNNVELVDSRFRFWDENEELKNYGMDYKHLSFAKLNGDFDDVSVVGDSVTAVIRKLQLQERSGFTLKNLSGNALVHGKEITIDQMNLKSSGTDLNGKLSFKYRQYSDLKKFVRRVRIQSVFTKSQLSSKDLSYFVPVLQHLNDSVQLVGEISGKVSRLKLKKFELEYGENTMFKGKISIDGLPDARNAFVYVDIKEFVSTNSDIVNIPLYPFSNNKKIVTPPWFKNLGKITFSGKYTGFSTDFVAYGKLKSRCGVVTSDVKFTKTDSNDLVIKGKVNASNFNLKRLLGKKNLGKLSFEGNLDAAIKNKSFLLKMKGKVPYVDFHDYRYTNINVDGNLTPTRFDGDLKIADTNVVIGFAGGVDFSKKHQEYKFKAKVEKANLTQLSLLNRDSSTTVSFEMDIDLKGNNVEDIYGNVAINDFTWSEKNKKYHFNSTILRSSKLPQKEMISVKSDWFVGRIEGEYELTSLFPSLMKIMSRDLPSLIGWKFSKSTLTGNNDFKLMFKVTDYNLFRDVFTPDLFVVNPTFNGVFNDKDQFFQMNFKVDTIKYKSELVHGLKVLAHNRGGQINVKLSSDYVGLKKPLGLKDFGVTATAKNNLADYHLSWNNNGEANNDGSIKGVLGTEKLDSIWTHINTLDLVIENNLWSIDSTNKLVFSPGKIDVEHFNVRSDFESIEMDGILTSQVENALIINTHNFQLGNLSRLFSKVKTEVTGSLSGKVEVLGERNDLIFKSDIEVDGFHLNGQAFGKVKIQSDYLSEESKLKLNVVAKNRSKGLKGNVFQLKGDYFPKRNGKIDLECKFSSFKVHFLEKYFSGLFSDFKEGEASGKFNIVGTLKQPEFYGKLRLDEMNLAVNYLKVNYAINAQYIYFNKDKMLFKDFTVRHSKYSKSKAVMNGFVRHTGFKKFSYSLDSIRLHDLYCLNTTLDDNSSYYGTAFVDGLLQVKGDGKNNQISGAFSTISYEDDIVRGQTTLNLPLSEVGELEVSDFIHFVDLDSDVKVIEKERGLDLTGMTLDLNFNVDESTKAKIIFDPAVGDEIQVTGDGHVNMRVTPEGKFQMSGKYKIKQGKYFFTLKDFIGKKFIVEEGGTILWDGDPLAADIDIQTNYEARAKLIDLANPTAANYESLVTLYGNRTAVYAGLSLKGELLKPEINMSVSLPNGTPQEKDFLSSSLVSVDEINRQVFALLLTNQFLPIHSTQLSDAVNIGTGIDNGIQYLEGQLNSALGGVFNNLDFGVNYNSSTQSDSLSNDELRLLLGFQYKKFSIKTDYALNNDAGEIQVEYKLTNQLRAKAYRRRTEQVIVDDGSNVTQGVGLVFQRSFNRLRDLFKKEDEP